mmetsp:Transcript_79461/g.221128  ORF Transcript_79461/g.221128 Transcript_79461/m.221128 type:complete len:307 (-) Transcript_79461:973-1893(-)
MRAEAWRSSRGPSQPPDANVSSPPAASSGWPGAPFWLSLGAPRPFPASQDEDDVDLGSGASSSGDRCPAARDASTSSTCSKGSELPACWAGGAARTPQHEATMLRQRERMRRKRYSIQSSTVSPATNAPTSKIGVHIGRISLKTGRVESQSHAMATTQNASLAEHKSASCFATTRAESTATAQSTRKARSSLAILKTARSRATSKKTPTAIMAAVPPLVVKLLRACHSTPMALLLIVPTASLALLITLEKTVATTDNKYGAMRLARQTMAHKDKATTTPSMAGTSSSAKHLCITTSMTLKNGQQAQ